ncbi:unnamed protein product [Clavelina lepadiformis]|uniref:Sushi domain-containing protein n=1 Tax=Clavelina lepadiformis TaxID=159417 RepID=A0ABP0FC77_CLALP
MMSLCHNPVASISSKITASNRLTWNVGENVTHSCNDHLELIGKMTVTCEAVDSFPNPPICV